MNRREFSHTLAGVWAATALTTAARTAPPMEATVSAAARALYRRALILDCNCAPPSAERLPLPQADLDLVRGSGIDVIKLSLGGINSDFAHTVAELALV